MAISYSEKLRNPLWQKKRLDILNRDNFTCQVCSDTETELHIHHKEYINGRKPWEYEDDNFQTLCKHCHVITETYKDIPVAIIVAGKSYNDKVKYTLISTILYSIDTGMILSIDRCHDNGTWEHVMMIDKQPFKDIYKLFQDAEKLLK